MTIAQFPIVNIPDPFFNSHSLPVSNSRPWADRVKGHAEWRNDAILASRRYDTQHPGNCGLSQSSDDAEARYIDHDWHATWH